MESISLEVILLIAIGSLTLVQIVWSYRDPNYLRKYVETSPKAALWRKGLGVERTIQITRRFFMPLGFVVSLAAVAFGVYLVTSRIAQR